MGVYTNSMISRDNILEIKSRRDIYQYISKYPGTHMSEISQKLNISRSALRYHLRYLTKYNLINYKIDRKFKRYYTVNIIGTKDQELLGLLRQEIPFKIIMLFFVPGLCSKNELAKELKLHPTTVDFHIQKFIELGIIAPAFGKSGKYIVPEKHMPTVLKQPTGREVFYTWKDNDTLRRLYYLLIAHKDNLIDPGLINAYYEFAEDWGLKKYKKHFTFDKTLDNVIEVFEEMCPVPFCV